jgi:protein TonB
MTTIMKTLLTLLRSLIALPAAAAITLLLFLLLPILQHINEMKQPDTELREVTTAEIPPPPPPAPEEPPKEEPKEEEPPQLMEQAQPLDLSQLELALSGGIGEGGGDFAIKLAGDTKIRSDEAEAVFSLDDLDQLPRVTQQRAPEYPPELKKKKISGTVYVIFVVSKQGRVEQAKVQKSTNPAFDAPALKAVKRWSFEPGRKNGKPVQFRMRVPISFAAH